MIDLGRKKDLEMLMLFVNDERQNVMQRRRAFRTMENIKRKMNDPFILKQRLRLIAANIAADSKEVEKIGDRLQEYEKRYYINRKF